MTILVLIDNKTVRARMQKNKFHKHIKPYSVNILLLIFGAVLLCGNSVGAEIFSVKASTEHSNETLASWVLRDSPDLETKAEYSKVDGETSIRIIYTLRRNNLKSPEFILHQKVEFKTGKNPAEIFVWGNSRITPLIEKFPLVRDVKRNVDGSVEFVSEIGFFSFQHTTDSGIPLKSERLKK